MSRAFWPLIIRYSFLLLVLNMSRLTAKSRCSIALLLYNHQLDIIRWLNYIQPVSITTYRLTLPSYHILIVLRLLLLLYTCTFLLLFYFSTSIVLSFYYILSAIYFLLSTLLLLQFYFYNSTSIIILYLILLYFYFYTSRYQTQFLLQSTFLTLGI